MGNRPSCQNPKARLSSELGIRGFSWWKGSQPALIRQCHVNVGGLWGWREQTPGPRKELEGWFTPEPQGCSPLDAKSCKVIRKADWREACPFVCSRSASYSQTRPVTYPNRVPAFADAKACRIYQRGHCRQGQSQGAGRGGRQGSHLAWVAQPYREGSEDLDLAGGGGRGTGHTLSAQLHTTATTKHQETPGHFLCFLI